MKLKTILIACVALLTTSSVMAQETKRAKMIDMTREQRVEMKAQMVAKKLMLDDATKAKFLPMYVSYQNELYSALPAEVKEKMEARKEACKEMAEKRAENRKGQGRRGQSMMHKGARGHGMMMGECDVDGKTDAEVKAMVESHFKTQEARLDINKKYFKKFSSILTVKQSAAALKSAQGPHHAKRGTHHGMKGRKSCDHKAHSKSCRK